MEKLIPKLRFPEFKEEWKFDKIGNLLSIQSGRDYKHLKEGNIPVYGTGGLMLYVNDFLHDGKSVCIGRKGTIDKPMFLNGKFWTVDTLFYSNNFKNTIPEYVYLCFLKINWKNHNEAGGVPSLSKKIINNILLSYPTLEEQTKIADFLGSVDKQLDILNKKKEKLNLYKKGVMQQLFSQQIRFKDDNGNDFPDWQEKTLGEVLKYTQPNRFIVKSTDYNDSYNTPVLTAGKSFLLGYTNETDNIYKDIPCIIFDDFTTSSQFVDFNFKIKSSAMKILNTIGEDNIKFLFELINTIQFPKGDEHKRYWISEYSKLVLNIPSIAEQTKIAEFLSAIDVQIETVENQITKTETYKKGLLQQMFV